MFHRQTKNIQIAKIIILLALSSCTSLEREYYENGNVKRITEQKKGVKSGTEVLLEENGDTVMISNYLNGKLHGQQIIIGQDSMFSKRVYNYKNDTLEGPLYEYINGQLRFIYNFKANKRDGEMLAYFPTGEIKYRGFFDNDAMCMLIEYDKDGVIKTIDRSISYDIITSDFKNHDFELQIEHCQELPLLDSIEINYAFYKVTKVDTIKITKRLYNKASSKGSQITIPFTVKDTGLYYIKVALPGKLNYESVQLISDLPFRLSKEKVSVIKSKKTDAFEARF